MRSLATALSGTVLLASVALFAGGSGPACVTTADQAPASRAGDDLAVPGADLATVRVRHYRMAGRVRPLLFWFGRDDVGLARVVWRRGDAGARGYELLVGTDPARAPRGINRWGFIAERVDDGGGALLGLMTGADEASYDEAAASAGSSPGDFRAIRGMLREGVARWRVARVRATAPLTVHDLEAAVSLVRQESTAVPQRQMLVAAGTRPGFLASVAELLDRAVTASGARAADAAPVRYVFGQRLYELRLREVRRQAVPFEGRRVPAACADFEIHNLSTGKRTAFEITAGTEGDLAGVPLLIQWQPRWWLKVELHLKPDVPKAS